MNKVMVTIHAQTGWLQLIIRIAQLIERRSPRAALVWLAFMRPVCYIRMRFDSKVSRSKWRFVHIPVIDKFRTEVK